jgi:threonine dehydratase
MMGQDASSTKLVPSLADLHAARDALVGKVIDTPLVASPALASMLGAKSVSLKLESFQHTGTFKFRGAIWRCQNLSAAEREKGVVAYSSGNFAQALAAAAQALNIPCTIVMPIDAPAIKRQRTEAFGARVIVTDHGNQPREAVASAKARELAEENGLTLLHPFDDPAIIAGHATLAFEVAAACKKNHLALPQDVLCCAGGGGLIAGLAVGFAAAQNGVTPPKVVPVEPEAFDAVGRSVIEGRTISVIGGPKSICDALQAPAPGAAPLASLLSVGTGLPLAVSDEEVRRAMRLAVELFGLVLEPSGAVPLAGYLGAGQRWQGRDVLIIASGRNITAQDFARLIAQP